MPAVGAALAAAGALMSDLTAVFSVTVPALTTAFDAERVNAALAELRAQCTAFATRIGADPEDAAITLFAEARYPQQIWELEVPLRCPAFATRADVNRFIADFHATHREILGISDERSPVEIVSWSAKARIALERSAGLLTARAPEPAAISSRRAFVRGCGLVDVPVRPLATLIPGETIIGPVLIELPFTTIVVADRSSVELGRSGSILISPIRSAEEEREAA